MASTTCPRCSAGFQEADGFFAAEGLICARCHANEEAADSERIREASEGGGTMLGEPMSSTKTQSEVRPDGTVVTHTQTTTIDAGPFNGVVGLLRRLFDRSDE
jgi:hypothetical protein